MGDDANGGPTLAECRDKFARVTTWDVAPIASPRVQFFLTPYERVFVTQQRDPDGKTVRR